MTDNAQLLRAFKIDAADLEANRAGRLGARQKARQQHNARSMTVIGVLLGGVFVVPLVEHLVDGSTPALGISIGAAVVGVGVFLLLLRVARRMTARSLDAQVVCVVGTAHLTQGGKVVHVTVGDRVGLQLPRGGVNRWAKLFNQGDTFRAYVRDDTLVGMELATLP